MSMNNLTTDGEFRYIIQWFNEWSELQRDDFIPIMVDYITDTNTPAEAATTAIINMNGIQNDMERSLNPNEKPMSLFQCRVKLFNQWNRKWPAEFKEKLQQKITELDNKVGERIKESINIKHNGSGSLTNGYAEINGDDAHHYECNDDMIKDGGHSNRNESNNDGQQQQQVENEIIVLTNAVTLNDPMREVLSNETSVDDIELNEDINKQQQVNIIEVEDNDNVAHDDGINEDCINQLSNDDDHAREPVVAAPTVMTAEVPLVA